MRENMEVETLVAGLMKHTGLDLFAWFLDLAQCLDHLAVTSEQFNSYFTEALDRGRRKWPVASTVPYRPSLIGGLLIKQVVPESARKFPAPKVFQPSQSQAVPGALEKFLEQQSKFMNYVREAKGLDFNKTRLRSPVTPLMRYSLADAFVHRCSRLRLSAHDDREIRASRPNIAQNTAASPSLTTNISGSLI